MFMAFFSWWYKEGWERQMTSVKNRLIGLIDTFSIDLIMRTLFAPFRQISAEGSQGPIGLQLRAFLDRLISRFIGAMVRMFVLIAGCIVIALTAIVGVIYLMVWPLIPVAPLLGLIGAILGGMA